LAEELVDFLLKEDELKKAIHGPDKLDDLDRTKPILVQEQTLVDLSSSKTLPKTVLIPSNEPAPTPSPPSPPSKQFVSQRANVVFNEVTQLMAGTEAVKVAQARINTLEKEKETLRTEIDLLLTSSETIQRKFNELKTLHENLERKHREKTEILEDEKAVIKTRLNAKEAELSALKRENGDLLSRFQSDLRKIRVRERELEHRQEIIRAEMVTVVRSKDEVIVELKRQLEKLHFELDNFRAKSADMNTKFSEFNDRNHRTVKALRLALSVLETGDVDEK